MLKKIVKLFTASESRHLDKVAIETDGFKEGMLMEGAGEAAYRHLRFLWPRARTVVLFCGPGNNGGDGYVLARKLLQVGIRPVVYSIGKLTTKQGDAVSARNAFEAAGGIIQAYQTGSTIEGDVVVDAILGTGSARELGGDFADAVNAINGSVLPVFALDMPTGIDSDSGRMLGVAVRADATLSFISIKRGALTSDAVDHTGSLYFSSLGVSGKSLNKVPTNANLITTAVSRRLYPTRLRNTYKSRQGSVLVVGGVKGMTGAAILAGQSALATGAGLVRVVSQAKNGSSWPELMTSDLTSATDLKDLVSRADVLVVGPGLGHEQFSQRVLGNILDFRSNKQALVLDADALACLAMGSDDVANAILTPHPGEAAALLSISVKDVQQDRFAAAQAIARKYNCICILKGAGTVISDGKVFHVCDRGGPELATAGTGDVLAGMIAAFAANGLESLNASMLAVFAHAVAGELCARHSGTGLVASDLFRQIPAALSQLNR